MSEMILPKSTACIVSFDTVDSARFLIPIIYAHAHEYAYERVFPRHVHEDARVHAHERP